MPETTETQSPPATDAENPHPYDAYMSQSDAMEMFLAAFEKFGTITRAAETCKIGRQTVYDWIHGDVKGFREKLEEARRGFTQTLENMMLDRLRDPTGNRGSDVLLMFSLNANHPSKYRPNAPPVDDAGKDIIKALRASGIKKLKARETVREIEVETEGER